MYCNWISGLLSIVFSLFGAMVPSLFAWRCFSLLARCLFGANRREADFIVSNLNHLGESTFFSGAERFCLVVEDMFLKTLFL